MAVSYSATFRFRHNGSEETGKIEIYTKNQPSTHVIKNLTLSSDPIVITYDEVALTDVIQPSQLRLSLIATRDGEYREIYEQTEPVYCKFSRIKQGGGSDIIWRGVLAEQTWTEPFSRERGYSLDISFSDFGYLERVNYDPAAVSAGTINFISIGSFLYSACSKLSEYATMEIVQVGGQNLMTDGKTKFLDMRVCADNFIDDDGKGHTLRDCIEKILEPTGMHIRQSGGKIYVFMPGDPAAATGVLDASLKAMGTDAELEAAEIFKNVHLSYPATESDVLGDVSYKATAYVGPWMYANYSAKETGSEDKYLICGTVEGGIYNGHNATMVAGTDMTPCVWISNAGYYLDRHSTILTRFILPDGYALPNVPTDPKYSSYEITKSFRYCYEKQPSETQTSGRLPEAEFSLVLRLSVFLSFRNANTKISEVSIGASVGFFPDDGSAVMYFDGTNWWNSTYKTCRLKFTNGDSDREWPVVDADWQELSLNVKIPSRSGGIGKITVKIFAAQLEVEYSENESDIVQFAIKDMSLETTGLGGIKAAVQASGQYDELFVTGGEDFEKEFDMGTPVMSFPNERSGYIGEDGTYTAVQDSTYLARYMEFLRRNFSLEHFRRRWRISGSYSYDHFTDIVPPVFDPTSRPLRTLKNNKCTWYLKSEIWHVRSGKSDIVLEEVFAADMTEYELSTEDGDIITDNFSRNLVTLRLNVGIPGGALPSSLANE